MRCFSGDVEQVAGTRIFEGGQASGTREDGVKFVSFEHLPG